MMSKETNERLKRDTQHVPLRHFFFLQFFLFPLSCAEDAVKVCVCVGVAQSEALFCSLSHGHAGLNLRVVRVAELCGRACTRASC